MAFQDFTFQFGDTLTASAMSAVQSNFKAQAFFESDSPLQTGRGKVMVHFASDATIRWSKNVSSVTKGTNGQYTIAYSFTFSQSIVDSNQFQHYGILANAKLGATDAQNVFATIITEQSSNRAVMYHHGFNEGADSEFTPDEVVFIAFE